MKFYKIKVGIEEYPVNESDLPRIAEAMKSNDIVRLDSGLFRGNAILAVCEDKSRSDAFLSAPREKTKEEIEIELLEEKRKEARLKCDICDHTGMKEELRKSPFGYESIMRVPCDCQRIY